VACRDESNDIVTKLYSSTFVNNFRYLTCVYSTYSKAIFIFIPWVSLGLFVSKRKFTSFNVKLKNYNLKFITYVNKLTWVLDLLSPRKVRDVDQSVDTFFKLNEYTEVCKVSNDTCVA
jgi:hypothetical protein